MFTERFEVSEFSENHPAHRWLLENRIPFFYEVQRYRKDDNAYASPGDPPELVLEEITVFLRNRVDAERFRSEWGKIIIK